MFRVEYKRIPRDDSGELIMEPYEFASKWIYYKPLLFLGKAYFKVVNLHVNVQNNVQFTHGRGERSYRGQNIRTLL